MISGKDVRIENGYIIINGEKYPIVQDTSDIEDDIEALDTRVSAIEATTMQSENISGYNSAELQFTAPTDGYVRVELRNTSHYCYLYVNGVTLLGGEGREVTNANDYISIFIKKGMKVYYNGSVYSIIFVSLT